jgi:hypothetical protein
MKLESKELMQRGSFSFDFENLKIAFFCLLLIIIVTQGRYDPAPFNLLQPPDGIANWFGLPGALLGGSLLFVLGQSALLFPLIEIFFSGRGWSDFKASVLGSLLAVFSLNTLIALFLRNNLPLLKDWTGLWGVTSALVTENMTLRLVFIFVLFLYLIRFFLNNRFNPKLFFLLSYLGITAVLFSVSSAKVINSFYLWGSKNLKLMLNHSAVRGGWQQFFFLKSSQQQKYPLIFYKDLINPNSKIVGSSPINLNCDDLKKRNTLQKTLAVMDKNYLEQD